MKNLFLILAAVLLSALSMFAQVTKPQVINDFDSFEADTEKIVNLYDNGIGLGYSTMSGYGLTFLRRFFNDYSIMLSGMISYNEKMRWSDMSKTKIEQDEKNNLYDIGIEIQRDIIKTNKTKIYAMIGSYLSTEKNKGQYSYNDVKNIISIGAGFGFQWYMARNFAGYFHFGYKFENTNKEQNNQPSVERKTTVGIGFGVMFLY